MDSAPIAVIDAPSVNCLNNLDKYCKKNHGSMTIRKSKSMKGKRTDQCGHHLQSVEP